MNNFNQFDNILNFNSQAFEPARKINAAAVETFEAVTRKNYEVIGDYVEFAVEQAKLSATANTAEYVGTQTELNRAFGEKIAARAKEYNEIFNIAQEKGKTVAEDLMPVDIKAA